MKVLFMTNVPSFYRMNFFNELGKYCELTVSYEKDDSKEYNYDTFYSFNHQNFRLVKLNNSFSNIKKELNNSYDIIIIGTYSTMIAVKAILYMKYKKIPFIMNADGGFVRNDGFIKNAIKKFFISKGSYWLSSGKMTNKYLLEYGAIKEKIFTYPFTSLYKKDILLKVPSAKEKKELRLRYNIPTNKKIFITIGRFYHIKGNDIVINDVIKNKYLDCEFYIISGGPLKEEFMKKIEEANTKNIHLIDYLPREDIYNYLKLSDVMIMPSRGDVWGLVINEAMSVGLPIISSNMCIAGVELLDKKYIFDINKVGDISKKIKNILSLSSDELLKIGKKELKIINDYTLENMAYQHKLIFDKILYYKGATTNEKK